MVFRDLQRYESQKSRFDRFKKWLELDPEARQKAYAAITDETKRSKPERVDGYVSPFGTLGTTKVFLKARILSSSQNGQGSATANTLRGLLANYVTNQTAFNNLPENDRISIKAKEFPFARLKITEYVPGTSIKYSRITGAGYKKPDVDTVSSPFGQNTGGQDYNAVVAAIEGNADFKTFKERNNGKNRYKFTPEG